MKNEMKQYSATFKIQVTTPILAKSLEEARRIAESLANNKEINDIVAWDCDVDQAMVCNVNEEE